MSNLTMTEFGITRIPTPSDDARPLTIDEAPLALCAQTDPDLWFPNPGETDTAWQARQICDACPIAARCLAIALARRPRVQGIWAGTNTKDRDRIRAARRRGIATAADPAGDGASLGEAA